MKKLVTKKVTQYEYDSEGRVTKITESSEEYKVDMVSSISGGTIPFKTAIGVPPTGKVGEVEGWKKTDSVSISSKPQGRVTGLTTTDILNEVKYALDNVNRTSAF